MARPKKTDENLEDNDVNDFTNDIMEAINKDAGEKIMFGMEAGDAPANVKRWISTGSKQLDYRISNQKNGGIPEGRITEIYGAPSCGKSHIAIQAAKSCQRMGGLVFYIDTEHAASLEYFQEMGIEAKNFKLVPQKVVEEIFSTIEKVIIMARNNDKAKELPILIVWDSIAASIPRSELEPSDKVQPGRLAAAMSIGLKRIVEVVGSNNVTLLLCNQTRTKIGVMFGDPEESAGGNAIKFYSSVRIKLSGKTKITDDKGNIIGNKIYCTIEKNKVAPPLRKCEVEIHFGVGIVESDYIFDNFKIACKAGPLETENYKYHFADAGGWKNISITNKKTGEVLDRRLHSAELQQFFTENASMIEEAMERVYVYKGVKNPLDA